MNRRQSLSAIFALPLVLTILSLIGLVSALAGDGFSDVVSWIALLIPVAAVMWAMKTRRS